MSPSVLFTGGPIRTCTDQSADWVLVEGETIAGVGVASDPPGADRVVDLEGATLVPGFCDAHVHLPATGLYALGLDFRAEHSVERILRAFADAARDPQAILFGGNFEDPLDKPITATDLDRAVSGRPALLARADMHSCIASRTLLEQLDLAGVEGVDRDEQGQATGYLRERAAAEAWRWFDSNLPAAQQQDAVRAAAQLAYAKGVTSVHEMFVVEWRGWPSLEVFLQAASELALDVKTYVATTDIGRVRAMGFDCVGGDLFLDGSFGTHTAWLCHPYESQPPTGSHPQGTAYRADEELLGFFTEAQEAGMQTGVHAIGDAAIGQALRMWEEVAGRVGIEQVRSLGHRLEHFECASDEHILRARELGLRVSVQPAFDSFWGGEHGMYAQRIGKERALQMNRFGSMSRAGLLIGAGSDSTVTPLDPFLQMNALRLHHRPEERLDADAALRMHTVGSHALAGQAHHKGSLAPGMRADLAVLDRDPVETDAEELLKTEVLATWISGRRAWPTAEETS